MLTGEYRRLLDDKGRLSLPPAFRMVLVDKAYVSIYRDRCIGIWAEDEARSALERLADAVRSGEATDDEFRRFSSSFEQVPVDAQGRLSLPTAKREELKIDKEVVLAGVFNRGEVWDAEEWRSVLSERSSDDIGRWL